MNYYEAYDFCQRESGYLAEPRSASQTEEINQLLSSDSNYWIGLTDKETEGVFIWNSDGVNCESYDNWASGQPDDCHGNEDCGLIAGGWAYEWDDEVCEMEEWENGPFYALCQKIV